MNRLTEQKRMLPTIVPPLLLPKGGHAERRTIAGEELVLGLRQVAWADPHVHGWACEHAYYNSRETPSESSSHVLKETGSTNGAPDAPTLCGCRARSREELAHSHAHT